MQKSPNLLLVYYRYIISIYYDISHISDVKSKRKVEVSERQESRQPLIYQRHRHNLDLTYYPVLTISALYCYIANMILVSPTQPRQGPLCDIMTL